MGGCGRRGSIARLLRCSRRACSRRIRGCGRCKLKAPCAFRLGYNRPVELLAAGARSLLNLVLTPQQLAAFEVYAGELMRWNEQFNLTGITDPEGIRVKHFLDSLSILKVLPPGSGPASVVDVGTGAGFPGLPLKIVRPELALTLVEATGKKVNFCEAIVEKLGLQKVTVLKARAEELGQDPAHRERYDWAMARAVAEMPVLAEYLLPLARVGGHALAQKGEGAPAEAQASEGALRKLGGELEKIVPIDLPGLAGQRYLVILKKVGPTPPAYPRRAGVPSKKPLS
jgi:16S rRNA (guanine527-N7)-methyltransferase